MADAGLAAVFLANRALVRRLVLARTRDEAEAEEILQELWLRLESARVGPVGEPLAYLMRMATNLATDRQLAERRRLAREAAWGAVQAQGSEFPDAERQLVSAEELARLQALLGSMPERMYRALVLFRIEGCSQRQIAEALGMSVSGVEKLLARAYRQLVDFRLDNATAIVARPASSPASPEDGRSITNG